MISLCLAFLLPPSTVCLRPVLRAFSLDKLCAERYKPLTPSNLACPAHWESKPGPCRLVSNNQQHGFERPQTGAPPRETLSPVSSFPREQRKMCPCYLQAGIASPRRTAWLAQKCFLFRQEGQKAL